MAEPKETRTVEIIVNGQKANASLKEMSAAAAVLSNQVAKIAADDPKRAELINQLQAMKQRISDARAEIGGLLTAEQQLAASEQALAAAQAATVAEQLRAIAAGKANTASLSEMKVAAGLLEQQLHELASDDPNRAALIKDFQTLRQRMADARSEMTTVIKTEAELRAEQDALRASQVQLVVNGQKVTASMREMREGAAQLEKELEGLAQDDPARGPMIASLQKMKERIKEVGNEVAGVSETTSKMKEIMTHAFAYVIGQGIEEVIFKVIELGKDIFDTTAKFEKYGAVLANALGSDSLAQKALADINQLAATTPFSVDELTESFIKFVNRGLQPSMEEMQNLADLAASQGKSFDQLTEAVLDAGTGEFERLKEFGIQASKSGNQVQLSFKGVQQTVANTPEAINAAILSFGDMKGVMGSTAAISATLEGQLSNLGDTSDQVAVEWGQTLRPVFVAVLSTLGFLLGVLKALPGFIKDNRAALLGLGVAVVTLNAEHVILNTLVLANVAIEKGRAIALRASAAAQWLLNAAMDANPIGLVVAAVAALIGLFVTLYERSSLVRGVINGLGAALKEFALTAIKGVMEQLLGFYNVLAGIFTLDGERIKKGLQESLAGTKAIYLDAGMNAAKAFGEGYASEEAKQASDANKRYEERRQSALQQMKAGIEKHLAARRAAQKAAHLEELKNEEADLKERLAKAAADSKAEMLLKQQLVTNNAQQELQDAKKTAAERRIILAEAEDARVKLAQDYFKKQAELRKKHQKEAAEAALKVRLAEIEAEKLHKEMVAQVRQAATAARGDELVTEMSQIYTQGQLKIAALEAEAQKEIAQFKGTAKQKAAFQVDIEKKLAADIALVRAEVTQKQGQEFDKRNEEAYGKTKEGVDRQVEAEEEGAARLQAAMEVPFHASLQLQREIEEKKYEIRQAAFERELTLIAEKLGKESAEYKKVYAAQEKDQQTHSKRRTAIEEEDYKTKKRLQNMEMQAAGDVLSFGLELLDQDADARKKHHTLYTALAAAKIIIDGTKEVQQIWEYSAENPANGPTAGAAGIAMGAIQTAVAIGRTAVALSKLGGGGSSSGGDNTSYWTGGRTGTGAGLAVSPMGQLLAMTGMSVGGDGRLQDGSGFAVAGIVHEDEYVIPKWQRADPQVAAVEQWLEARRLRGFADGGPTTSGSSGAALPVAAASPSTDGEKTYAVQTQMLAALLSMGEQLADVKQWQSKLQVSLDLRAAQTASDELKQVQYDSAIRSKN